MTAGEGGGEGGQRIGLARRTFLGFRADAINALAMLVASVIVARGLGPTDRGLFFLVFIAATLIALMADLGLSATSITFGANREIPASVLHGAAICLSVTAAAVTAIVLLPLSELWTQGVLNGLDTTQLALLAVGILPLLYAQVIVALLTGMGHVPEVSALRIFQAGVYLVLITPTALSGDPTLAIAAWLATNTVYAAALCRCVVRKAGRPGFPRREVRRRILSFGGRSYVGTLSYNGFLRVDVLFLSGRYGPATVGIYSLATMVAEKIGLVGHAMYGATAEAVGKGGTGAASLTALTFRMMLTMLLPIAVVLAAISQPLFRIVFGEAFEDAALPFVLLLPGAIALACWAFVSLFIISGLRRPGAATLIQGTALIFSLPAYWFAVRAEEMTGAALVSSGTYLAVLAAGVALMVRTTDVRLAEFIPGREDPARLMSLLRRSLSRA